MNPGEYTDVLYEEEAGVARISINRPDKLNSIRCRTVEELIEAFRHCGWNDAIGVIVLTGIGKAFCVGGDQSAHDGLYDGRGAIGLPIEELQSVIRDVPKPVIARVQGYAIGGGNVLATLCDLTIAGESAVFGQVGPKVGSVDAGFGTAYLARVVGEKKAREMWYLCRRYSAQEALSMGLVNTVVPDDELDAEVDRWCAEINERSPTAIALAKLSFNTDSESIRATSALSMQALKLYYQTDEFTRRRPCVPGKAKAGFSREPEMSGAADAAGNAALVVGGGRGVGRACCVELAAAGMNVGFVYRSDEAAADRTLDAINAHGALGAAFRADVRDRAAVDRAFCGFMERFGRLDAMVHSAGAPLQWRTVREHDPEAWTDFIASDLCGAFHSIQAALRRMTGRGGAIVAISSIAAQMCQNRNSQGAAAKAGLEALIRVTAREEGRNGIRANVVSIGLTDTDMTAEARAAWGEDRLDKMVRGFPVPRIGEPAEIARVVRFLLGPEASYITGKVLQVDGGQFIGG